MQQAFGTALDHQLTTRVIPVLSQYATLTDKITAAGEQVPPGAESARLRNAAGSTVSDLQHQLLVAAETNQVPDSFDVSGWHSALDHAKAEMTWLQGTAGQPAAREAAANALQLLNRLDNSLALDDKDRLNQS